MHFQDEITNETIGEEYYDPKDKGDRVNLKGRLAFNNVSEFIPLFSNKIKWQLKLFNLVCHFFIEFALS